MTSIPILDLKTQYASIQADVEAAVLDVLSSGRYVKGATVETFEHALAQYIGVNHCVSCNSGTDALYLALRALEIGPGDEVITTPFTFIATAETISAVGATPVFVDIDANTFNLDLTQVSAAITGHTRAIIPVHLFGNPVNMPEVMAIAEANNLQVIEDCAQAIGAEWQGKKVGSIGHIGCFSFYPTKNLGACGDGGAITTNDAAIAQQIAILGDHGRKQGYCHEEIGVNSRLDAIQAAILSIKLQHLDEWNHNRAQVASRYHNQLADIPYLHLPHPPLAGRSVWNQYTTRIVTPSNKKIASASLDTDSNSSELSLSTTTQVPAKAADNWRDRVRQSLQEQGIGTMVYYPLPLHRQPIYTRQSPHRISLPVAEQLADQVLSLPMFPELTPEHQSTITQALTQTLSKL